MRFILPAAAAAAVVAAAVAAAAAAAGMSVSVVNAKADVLRAAAALAANCNAAKGLQDVLKSNLGPKGTVKMLVGGVKAAY